MYVLIFLLNTERDSDSFISVGSVLQSFCPRNRTVSVPNLIVLTFGKHMFPPSLSPSEGTFSMKISFIKLGAFPDFVLYVSVRSEILLKQGKLLNIIWHIGDKIRQFSTSSLWYSGSRIFSNAGRLYWLTRYIDKSRCKWDIRIKISAIMDIAISNNPSTVPSITSQNLRWFSTISARIVI